MDQTITAKLAALNQADLTSLAQRIAALKAEYEKALATKGKNANATATEADIKNAAQQAGVSVEDLLAALETAKRRGLI